MARQRKPASRTNRIIVVHNGIEVTEKHVLQNLIDILSDFLHPCPKFDDPTATFFERLPMGS